MLARKKATRNLTYREGIKVDWKQALKEGDELLENAFNKPFEEKMKDVDLVYQIKHYYGNDDTINYMELIEKNRTILKGAPATTY